MTKNSFNKKIDKLKKELNKYNIEVIVDKTLNPEQLSSEFYKHNDKLGTISFRCGNKILIAEESGAIECNFYDEVERNCRKSFNSDWDKDTFEEAMDIHTDRSLRKMEDKIYYSLNNWFNVYCGIDDDTLYENPDPDVIYTLEDMLDSNWVIQKFIAA